MRHSDKCCQLYSIHTGVCIMKNFKRNFLCEICQKKLKSRVSLRNHYLRYHYQDSTKKCKICDKKVAKILQHVLKEHATEQFNCTRCSFADSKLATVEQHVNESHSLPPHSPFSEIETAFNRRLITFQNGLKSHTYKTIDEVKVGTKKEIKNLLFHQLQIKKLLKFSLIVRAEFVKYDELGGISTEISAYLRSSCKNLFLSDAPRIRHSIRQCFSEIQTRREGFVNTGSGWSLAGISYLNIEVGKLSFAGGCADVKFGLKSQKKKWVVDIDSKENKCFLAAVALGCLPPSTLELDRKRLSIIAEKYSKRFNVKNLTFPLNLKQIHAFERKNKELKIQIRVYTEIEGRIIPVHKSRNDHQKRTIHLFLQRVNHDQHHYVYIKDLNSFFQAKSSKKYICGRCLTSFSTESCLENHSDICDKIDPIKVEYPEENTTVSFRSFEKQTLQPIFGACDFEASLVPVSREENAKKYKCNNCEIKGPHENCKHKTFEYNEQVPTTYSIILLDKNGKLIFEKTESDFSNVMEKFFKTLNYIEQNFIPLLQQNRYKTDYSVEENQAFYDASLCYLCKLPFQPQFSGRNKVRDHCHYSGEFLGVAHSNCNWKRTTDRNIPIFIHNFQNYDSQFIMQGLKYCNTSIDGIPYNMEKFRTLNVGRITFVDSLQLLPASLDVLTQNLTQNNHKFELIDQIPFFSKFPKTKSLLLRKGIYPYDWAKSVSQLQQTKKWPKHKHFFSILKQSNISLEDYRHGRKVFKIFQCENMLDYCHLYCRLDTVLLLEIMSEFRKNVFTEFGLDCTKYISAPQLAFDSMLRGLDEPINLMTDPGMILMCEQNVRGGVAFVGERHVRCNELEKEIKLVIDGESDKQRFERIDNKNCQDLLAMFDAVALYSYCQTLYLPWGNYQWCNFGELERLSRELAKISPKSDIGFILEVDLEYPPELHKLHDSFPMISEKKIISFSDLSEYSQKALIALNGKSAAHRYKSEKLVTDFSTKNNYVVHYRNLQTYLRAGIKLKKIHRAIKFTQKPYLRSFIEKCAKKRAEANSEFLKMLFKLFSNSVYGKFLQDNRKHMEAKVCTKHSIFAKYYNSPLYKGHKIVSDNVVTVFCNKSSVKLDKLYATGFSILELSKNHMISSWYNFFLPNLQNKASVVLTDTDSFLIHAKNMSRNELFAALNESLDYSNYPPNNPKHSKKVKGIPGYFKDENAGNYLTEVGGLKAKCYILNVYDQNNSQCLNKKVVCKGVQKRAREQFTMAQFRSVLKNFKTINAESYLIKSKTHRLYTQKLRKVALSSSDDKRYLLPCGIHTIPYCSSLSKICDYCK